MKVGNLVNGLAVVDVKRVNKLNLIQFLKDVNSYLELGYKIDVNSGRQVGLVLMVDLYKTEASSSVKVGSTNATSNGEGSVGELFVVESNSVVSTEEAVAEVTEQPKENVAAEPVEEVVKKPTPRAKKTT
jgi:hypothetical protein